MKKLFLLSNLAIVLMASSFAQNVGIGTITPASKLHIKGSVDATQLIIDANSSQSNTNPLIKLRKSDGTDLMWIHSDNITNSFVGLNAGRMNTVGTGGVDNNFIGSNAGFSNTTGFQNTANGAYALYFNTTGFANTANGYTALYYNTTGTYNTAVGYSAGCINGTAPSNFTAIGYNAGMVGSNSNTVEIGNTGVSWIGGQVGWSTYSDGRIKDNIVANVPGLAFISRLRPVTYNLNIHRQNLLCGIADTAQWEGKHDIEKITETGFIAQEVEQAAIESNYNFNGVQKPKNNHDLYSLNYSSFVVPLVKAVQELEQIIETQKADIDTLKVQVAELSKALNLLKNK